MRERDEDCSEMELDRRDFLRTAGVAAGTAAFAAPFSVVAASARGANDRIGVGFIGSFAKPVITVPLLLNLAEIPSDIFHLYLSVGVVASRFGDLMKAMHLFAFTALTVSILAGEFRLELGRLGLADLGDRVDERLRPQLVGAGHLLAQRGGRGRCFFARGPQLRPKEVGCIGLCSDEPLVDVQLPGRTREDECIFFSPLGMGIEDLINAHRVYQEARRRGIGQELELWHEPLWT